eukprot:gene37225-48089_t
MTLFEARLTYLENADKENDALHDALFEKEEKMAELTRQHEDLKSCGWALAQATDGREVSALQEQLVAEQERAQAALDAEQRRHRETRDDAPTLCTHSRGLLEQRMAADQAAAKEEQGLEQGRLNAELAAAALERRELDQRLRAQLKLADADAAAAAREAELGR